MAKHFSLTSAKLRERKLAATVKARFQFHPYFLSRTRSLMNRFSSLQATRTDLSVRGA